MTCDPYQIHVPFYEVDLGGGVYHGNYFHFFDQARGHWLKQLGPAYTDLIAEKRHLTVAEARIRYFKPVLYDDAIAVHTHMADIGEKSIHLKQAIYRGETLCTDLDLHMVCVDFQGKPQPLPALLLNAFAKAE